MHPTLVAIAIAFGLSIMGGVIAGSAQLAIGSMLIGTFAALFFGAGRGHIR